MEIGNRLGNFSSKGQKHKKGGRSHEKDRANAPAPFAGPGPAGRVRRRDRRHGGHAAAPGQLGPVYAVSADSGDTDDRCGLYLRVLEDLWETDPALNTDLEELALDLSGLTDLSESEKDALVWQFGNAHGLMPVTATWEELVEEGRIDGEALTWNGRGCLFTLTGSAEEGFSAEKWASGLGAYCFRDCTAQKAADGTWSYEVGAHAIA